MKLTLNRYFHNEHTTLGKIKAEDDSLICFSLEDTFRKVKVKGQTRIPAGTYRVTWRPSARFKRDMLHLENVPGFDGILIHSGNGPEDTQGCVLVGESVSDLLLKNSRIALDKLIELVLPSAEKGDLSITILDDDLHGDS